MNKKLLFTICIIFSISTYSQVTLIPDSNFEQALIDLGIDTDNTINGQVATALISGINTLDISGENISDLTGIEDFTSLIQLHCYNNNLTSLDLSSNTALVILLCYNNLIIDLDLTNNSNLSTLLCHNNNLFTLAVDNGNNVNFTPINFTGNPNLTCIQVDDIVYSDANWLNIDAHSFFSLNCHYYQTYVPNNNFEQILINLGYDNGSPNDYVPTANIETVTTLDVSNSLIDNLTGIEDFAALEQLFCQNNALNFLDVSQNTALTHLRCFDNNLTTLDVTQNPALVQLRCQNNQLLFLDLNLNTNLIQLRCDNNQLYNLNVKNGNNTNFTQFNALTNTNLTCVEVDDIAYSDANWSNIDAQTSFLTSCAPALTYMPDDNFEQALIDLGLDSGPLNNYAINNNITLTTTLGIDVYNISDLTGIEGFVSLTTLFCNNNNLTDLDLSQNTQLQVVSANNNNISTVDVINCSDLTELNIAANNLNTINVSANLFLSQLHCYDNQITNLDISQNDFLTELQCQDNLLTTLNTTQNSILSTLVVSNNQLSTLNVSQNLSLTQLASESNLFSSLNLSQNSLLTFFSGNNNSQLAELNIKNGNNTAINTASFLTLNNPLLTCIEVDDETYSTTNWTNIDVQTVFNEDCASLSIDEFTQNITLYPNPVKDAVTITMLDNANYEILTITGQVLQKGILNIGDNAIDFKKLPIGIYLLYISNNSNHTLKKIIKN